MADSWLRRLPIVLGLGFLGAALSELEKTFQTMGGWTPGALFPSHADPQVAQIFLGGIAASIITVVSIVFAVMLMTLTLACVG